ncbi:MAG TPA: hypothetical protein VNQ73_09405 [Ilumatobacter sp.]|nr:hypothetical protein [Ilumatobacter sp.]
MTADPPFDAFDFVIDIAHRRRPFDDDPSADLQTWTAILATTPFDEDGHELEAVRLATCELLRLNLNDTLWGPDETIGGLDPDIDAYAALVGGNEIVVEDVFCDQLVIVNRTTVFPAFRGLRFGPWLTAEAIYALGGPTTLTACLPAPFELDRRADPAGYRQRQAELRALWERLGFEPFDDEVMILHPEHPQLVATLNELRHQHGGANASRAG